MEEAFNMRDLRFYNTPIDQPGIAGFFITLPRRCARKLLLPFFARLVEILDALARHSDQSDQDRSVLRAEVHRVDGKAEAINRKFDLLNAKFDELNLKMETLRTEFGELKQREDALRDEFAAVVALNWDHVAVGRRLAQLEDRMLADVATGPAPDQHGQAQLDGSILFPGLERFERRTG